MKILSQRSQVELQVQRWIDARLIDAETGTRIVAFELGIERKATLRWPVLLAMIFGGILLAAGVTLFVAAHWDELSPTTRFSLMILLASLFHVAGALLTDRFQPLSTTLHAVGTATLGAAIFLTAQIFNLQENWSNGVLLWALGAAAGYLLLRDWAQAAILSLLAPGWLISKWSVATEGYVGGDLPLAVGLILIAICYLSARADDEASAVRRSLAWIGGLALLPCVGTAVAIAMDSESRLYFYPNGRPMLPVATLVVGWTVALAAPLALAWFLRGRAAWIMSVWTVWACALILCASHSSSMKDKSEYHRSLGFTLTLYALCAIGAASMVAWGLYDKRKERLNLGIAGFAISVLYFYFDSFMGKLGRSASLLILGVLCLAGGYALEITRRKLMARMETGE